jgi:AraC-like DNA-binding protein
MDCDEVEGRDVEDKERQDAETRDGAEIRTTTVRERPDSGLTAEELKDPWKAMFSGGVMKMFNARKALAVKELGDVNSIHEGERYAKECKKFGEAHANTLQDARDERRERAQAVERVPLWQQLSGLYPDHEPKMSPRERLGAMLLLVKKAEALLRYEIKYSGEHASEIDATEVRTYLSDPLRTVCFHLGISQRRLTAYCKELTGMSAVEMVDRLKAEGVRGKIKEELRKFIKLTAEELKDGETGGRGDGEKRHDGAGADEFFLALKKSRRDGRWHRTTWAMGLGFSSYQRFFRACLLCFGKTPHEVEMELIEEILKEAEREVGSVATGTAVAVRKDASDGQCEATREAGVSVT